MIFNIVVLTTVLWSVYGADNCDISSQLLATVLSINTQRYDHTKHILNQVGFNVSRFNPEREVHSTDMKVYSNLRAFEKAIQLFVKGDSENSDWMFFMEDDLAINPSLNTEQAKSAIMKLQELARFDGIAYLGICGPSCDDCSTSTDDGITFQRCSGNCAHAFGITKEKSKILMPLIHHFKSILEPMTPIYFDQLLHMYGDRVHSIWVAGTDLRSPLDAGHVGIFFQNRELFPSSI